MSESDFNFQSPKRREAKRFEPPPWERDAFEELKREKGSEERAAEKTETPPPDDQGVADTVDQQGTDGIPPQAEPSFKPEKTGEGLDEKQMIEMMARLAEEEPNLQEKTWKPALFSAMFVGALGVVMTVWGLAAMVRTRAAGLTGLAGSLVLMLFGLGFVTVAVWMIVRTLRQRGVL